jgi:glycosyltransferase involved in cell wall biosynthesis
VRRVCYAGTYEREYPRNSLIIQALRDAGVRVEECHQPLFERSRDKSSLPIIVLAMLCLKLTFAYLRLIPDVGLRLLRCDALVVGYIGQLDVIVLGTVARLAGKPVVFNPLVSLTDTLVEDRAQFSPESLPGRLIRKIDRISMSMADLVLADTDENAHYLSEQFDLDPDRIAVVQVGAPEAAFFPATEDSVRNEVLDVLFVGKFIPLHGVCTILEAASILQDRGRPVCIEMVGTGQEYQMSRDHAERLGLRNIVWTEWIPFELLGDRVRSADVVLGIFDDGAKAARVIPNKVHQALACAVPVVTRHSPAVEPYLADGETAILVPPADPVALANAIECLFDPERRRSIGIAGNMVWKVWGSRQALAFQTQAALQILARQA